MGFGKFLGGRIKSAKKYTHDDALKMRKDYRDQAYDGDSKSLARAKAKKEKMNEMLAKYKGEASKVDAKKMSYGDLQKAAKKDPPEWSPDDNVTFPPSTEVGWVADQTLRALRANHLKGKSKKYKPNF